MLSKKSNSCETPTINNGVNSTEECSLKANIDWLQGSFNSKHNDTVIQLLTTFLGGGEFEFLKNGIKHYKVGWRHPSGVVVGSGLIRPDGSIDSRYSTVQLKGGHLAPIAISRIRKLMRVLSKKVQLKCTHIDINIDDYERRFDIRFIKECYDNHKVVGFRNTGELKDLGKNGSKGLMFSLGRRGSNGGGKRIMWYDKNIESKGLINAIRVELSLYGHHAQEAFKTIAFNNLNCLPTIIHGYIVGAVDFRDRQGERDKNPGRRERLEFYKWFADDVPEIVVSLPYKVKHVDKLIAWFELIAPSFYVVMTVLITRLGTEGFDEWFWKMVFNGEKRLNSRHKYLISTA